ncbi:hypothetical protein KEM63_02930 [Halopseudomonas nanhaiensis]|uniref:hypothetical protein n=1 Tax=Halopseudomonas nanhaiensis TaxID=2830842 RepID=UPI001CC0E541|nr:hypothetical protein [Halopseudomonas nanhaiensis]UAW98952.1 hypothetical protein KEM63_02930 [Halopseudomonas nanhaiensis]
MNSTFYIPRKLLSGDGTYTERSLLEASNWIVVLAEPGGGKTELMGSLAQKLGVSTVAANVFGHTGADTERCPLVIDAFDELAKVDQSGIHKLLAHAKKASPTHVIISSRSSEWGDAATIAFQNFLSHPPLVVRLCEFDEAQQKAIFDNHIHGEDFDLFKTQVSRFDLEALLPNPQFLKLFADAYIESGKEFADKRSIFSLAVERLAKEANRNIASITSPLSTMQKVGLASEVFAKLLLSGAGGVTTNEATEDRLYPLLASLSSTHLKLNGILATRLFKPGDKADQHSPVHKIVAEYCGAAYLTRRVADPADSLTLAKCLPIIAPNSVVRDELRGLLGWMATLGNKATQASIIELDPYAVLANGDPSQLEQASKRLLIRRLKEVEAQDPYFRRGDYQRRFSVAGFFSEDIVGEIKPVLESGSNGHLRELMLELIKGSPAVKSLECDLRQILLAPDEMPHTRWLACDCLLNRPESDQTADLAVLVSEASAGSLKVAAEIIASVGPETIGLAHITRFLKACAGLYPSRQQRRERVIGGRYFVRRLIAKFELPLLIQILNELTGDIACKCGLRFYECDCRSGISKIVGLLLDRYFELAAPPYDSQCVWQWLRNLRYDRQQSMDQSNAVKVLQEDHALRQGIIAQVFSALTDPDLIFETKIRSFDWHSHSGLTFRSEDYQFLTDLAFDIDNPALWGSFMARHNHHRSNFERGGDIFRRRMREQASKKPLFMREWVKHNRSGAAARKENRGLSLRRARRLTRREKKQGDLLAASRKYIQENRELIESGRHWSCLIRCADLVLALPEEIDNEFGDRNLVHNALVNCLDYIAPSIPDLLKLAELRCASLHQVSEKILYAACLEILREKGSLEDVDVGLLQALRTNMNMYYDAVSEEERLSLKVEVDRLIFPDPQSSENYLREYLEPQLGSSECNRSAVWLLQDDEAFSHLRASLSIDWLERFPELKVHSLDTLFEIAAQHGNRDHLKRIIRSRCEGLFSHLASPETDGNFEERQKFWFLRAWYFLSDGTEACWDWLKSDPDTLFALSRRSGRMDYHDHPYWPKLTPPMVESILDAFIEKWPKVELASQWGTDSPKEEIAYRFLREIVWLIESDDPREAIPVLERLLDDPRFDDMHQALKSIHTSQLRRSALRYFEPPTPAEIVDRLDHNSVVTVEGLRQTVMQELDDLQKAVDGGEFNTANRFYEKGDRLGEVRCTEIIAERLSLRLEPQNISVTPEHQLKDANRSDFTVTKVIDGKRRLLVTEVKGQWHAELFTAASAQLHDRYAIHPDAEQQGIFLVIWFGVDEKVAGQKQHGIESADELKNSIKTAMPPQLKGLIDVFILDVSKA